LPDIRAGIPQPHPENLSTLAYNVQHANIECYIEHLFIKIDFKPISHMDLNDTEKEVPGVICEQVLLKYKRGM
jgi:hypothetical protein